MIYTNFVDLYSLILHAEFQNHWTPGSEEEDVFKIFVYVTKTIYANFHSLFLRMLHINFGFDWPSGFREDV